jgi:hypothetical protein
VNLSVPKLAGKGSNSPRARLSIHIRIGTNGMLPKEPLMYSNAMRGRALGLVLSACAALAMLYGAWARPAETAAPSQPQSPTPQATGGGPPQQPFSVKSTFANICNFCHEN